MTVIKKVEVFEVKLKLFEPFRIAPGVSEYSHNLVVKIETSSGIVGWGEGSPSYRVCRETVESGIEYLRCVAPKVLGLDIFEYSKIREVLESMAGYPAAKTAFETALLDAVGQELGKPLYKLFGGYRSSVVTDITLGIKEPDEMAKEARRFVDQGFKILKVKLGEDPDKDIERIAKIRESVGDDVVIRIDANEGWTVDQAIYVLNKIAEYNIELCEQPVKAGDLEGLAKVRRESPIPIMADESAHTCKDVHELVKYDAVDYVNIKIAKTGGLIEAIHLAHVAEEYGIKCMIGCMGESEIGIVASLHLAQGVKNIVLVDLDSDLLLAESLAEDDLPKGPKRAVPTKPGLGLRKIKVEKMVKRGAWQS